jgi:hypothetical protein
MAVFSAQIRDLTEKEIPLYYRCQKYYSINNKNVNTASISDLNSSSYYTRIYFPNSSFKSFYDLDIEFEPFNENIRCYFEVESLYNNCKTSHVVRPFLVKLSDADEEIFEIDKDIIMLTGKAYFGKDYYELTKGIKELAKPDQIQNFISEVNQGLFPCSRYIPDITEFMETLDETEIIEKLVDCYNILLNDIDENNVIDYKKMIRINLDRICQNIIKPIILNILTAPKSTFEIFMTPYANIDNHKEKILDTLQIKKSNLFLLECIKSFSKFIKIYVDFEAFIDEKSKNKEHYNTQTELDILPIHRLAYWEIVKYIHDIFKDKYIALKMGDTQVISHKVNNIIDSDDNMDDDDLTSFFDSFNTNTFSFANPTNNNKFIPEPYSDFYDFKTSQTIPFDTLSFDINSLDDTSRNIILQELETPISFDDYKQLLPKSLKESMFVTGDYAKI